MSEKYKAIVTFVLKIVPSALKLCFRKLLLCLLQQVMICFKGKVIKEHDHHLEISYIWVNMIIR